MTCRHEVSALLHHLEVLFEIKLFRSVVWCFLCSAAKFCYFYDWLKKKKKEKSRLATTLAKLYAGSNFWAQCSWYTSVLDLTHHLHGLLRAYTANRLRRIVSTSALSWNVGGFIIIIIVYPLSARAVGTPQMISQPVSSIFLSSPLPSGTWRTPGLSIPWCCLPISSSVSLVFFPLSLCLARWFGPELMNGKHDHTTAVCVFLRSSGDLRVVRLPAGSWRGLPLW